MLVNSLRPSDACLRQWTNHHWFRQWLVAWPAPSRYLNQCWNIVNWTIGNKFQWNMNRNSYIFIQENAFENVVWKMAAILSRPQCVNIYQFVIALISGIIINFIPILGLHLLYKNGTIFTAKKSGHWPLIHSVVFFKEMANALLFHNKTISSRYLILYLF